jgi:hypothetical protein
MECVFFDESSKVLCNDNDLIYIKPFYIPITTTTTTTSPITTTTTTGTIIDIYYGSSINSRVTENVIISTFNRDVGYVGSTVGRRYVFEPGFTYKYWCIPDLYNDGNKVIKEINDTSGINVLAYDSYYRYYQTNPTPMQSVTYGKITINGIIYRIYRTITKSSSYPEYYVYSF